jgi:hypothetical protein
MQAALRSRLLADATIAGLVGTRVDWGLRPQAKSLPAITLDLPGSPRDYHMGGAQNTQITRVQIDAWGTTPKQVKDIADAVIAELEPRSGSFEPSFVLLDRSTNEKVDDGVVYRRQLDMQITYISA